jgi:hypothetical protein
MPGNHSPKVHKHLDEERREMAFDCATRERHLPELKANNQTVLARFGGAWLCIKKLVTTISEPEAVATGSPLS